CSSDVTSCCLQIPPQPQFILQRALGLPRPCSATRDVSRVVRCTYGKSAFIHVAVTLPKAT
ncbi:uncharacterized, partial [Tachysurus ichikawai]